MDCSTPGLPVHHQLPEFTQTHVHQVGDVIQPSHPPSGIPFSSYLQSFPASGSLPMSQFFTSGGQSIRVSASASVLPMNIQDWFPLGWTGWISLQSKGHSRVFPNITVQKHQFFDFSFFFLFLKKIFNSYMRSQTWTPLTFIFLNFTITYSFFSVLPFCM